MSINGLDIETFGREKLIPYCMSWSYRNLNKTLYGIDCIKDGINWMFEKCSNNTIFFAHNLTFDGSIILNYIDFDVEIDKDRTLLRGGDIYCICLKKKNKKIFLKCSAKILPLELREIAIKLKIPGKIDFNHEIVNENLMHDVSFKNSAISYCEQDVKILISFMYKINSSVFEYFPNWWKNIYSISGLSLKIFSTNFNDLNVPLTIEKKIDSVVRLSYYGGRCEVFGNPKKNEKIFHFDFSGMYTNRLKELFPLESFTLNNNPSDISKPGFYKVFVESNLSLPILPYRDDFSGKLLFPNGFFSGLYWWEELNLFVENGGVIKSIEYSLEFKKSGYPFKNFAEKCEELRRDSDINKIVWKLIPNSFVGRLGLKNDSTRTVIIDDSSYNPLNLDVISDKKINNKWIVNIKIKETSLKTSGNVIFPSIVTSKARVLWWKSAQEVIKKNGRLLYCDTDSIFAAFKKNVSNQIHGDIFWDTKKNDTIIDDACFATNKVYCVIYKNIKNIKMKGVSKKNTKNLSMEEFKKLFYENKKKSIKTTLFDKNFLDMKISEIDKIIDFGGYDKRIFNKTKSNTSPLIINEIYPM